MYECTICLSLNHASRLHCQNCGAVPAMYSIIGKPCRDARLSDFGGYSSLGLIEIVSAHGVDRASSHHAQRAYLRTQPLDYYGE